MATWSNGSLRAGQKIRNSQGGDPRLSKTLSLNGKYRLFFKTFVEEVRDPETNEVLSKEGNVRAAVVPGRTGDYQVVGTGFIPYTDEMYSIDPITDRFTDTTELSSWSRIAHVLFEAQCRSEKKNAEAEALRAANELGKAVDTMALQKKIEGIEEEYHGGESASGDKILPKKFPALSGSIVFKVSTRVLRVALDGQGKPDWKDAQYATLELSKARANKLIALLDDPKYFRNEDYLEVGYNYIGSDNTEAGRNAEFLPVGEQESLEYAFPSEWEAIGKSKVEQIATGTADEQVAFMRARNRSFRGNTTPRDIVANYKKWCSTHQAIYGSIDFDDDDVKNAAKIFLESHLLDDVPKQRAAFEQIVADKNNGSVPAAEPVSAPVAAPTPAPVEQPAPTQSINDIMNAAAANPAPAPAPVQTPATDDAALASAMQTFASGTTDNQTVRNVANSGDIDISDGDDLGDL